MFKNQRRSNERRAGRRSGGGGGCLTSVNSIASTDFPTVRASPDAPPRPGVEAASANTVAQRKAPSAEPIANQLAASLNNGDSDMVARGLCVLVF